VNAGAGGLFDATSRRVSIGETAGGVGGWAARDGGITGGVTDRTGALRAAVLDLGSSGSAAASA
jgi:hypothetical protein